MTNLPILGAAMTLKSLATHRDWLLEHQRDLELQDFVEADVLNGDWSPLVARARSLLDGHTGRVGIHGPFWGFVLDTEDPDVRAVVSKRLDQGLSVCEALGATHMVIHSPFTTWSYNHIMNERDEFDAIIERCHLSLGAAVKRAEEIGCTLVIENIEDKDPAHRLALADSLNSPAVALSVDTGHAHYAHGSTGAPPVDHYIRIAGNRLQHVHLQDADGYADRHWSLGEGNILWHSVFAALSELTSNPRLIIELRDHSKIPASAAHLAALGLAI
ncbi:sugar phosphate isomerase/epimerase [Pseudomonas sp. R2.Fl]|nr:sugar phosphate isomerase/epimerase [Pseudomonas sp. R2.Fl]